MEFVKNRSSTSENQFPRVSSICATTRRSKCYLRDEAERSRIGLNSDVVR